jgi:hypothetical protein
MTNLEKAIQLINKVVERLVKGSEREVLKRYAKMLAEIRSMLALLYEKYETGGVLTYEEMAKFDRLNKFLNEVNQQVSTNYKEVADTIVKLLEKVFKEGYYLTAWGIETEAQARLAYSTVTSDAILEAINNPVSGLTLKQRLEKNRAEIIYRIQQEVTQGLVKGETYREMAGRIKSALDGDATKAVRVVRTEAHRVQESAKHGAAAHANKQGVIMMKEWNSMEDERVRPGRGIGKKDAKPKKADHRMLNGKKIPIDEDFVGLSGRGPAPGNLHSPAEDINCRCFLTYSIKEVAKPRHDALEDMSYDQWTKERLK